MHRLSIFIFILALTFIGCENCDDENENILNNEEATYRVHIQTISSIIEGMTVCSSDNTCKSTDENGMVYFDELGTYDFKIRDMLVSSLDINQSKTIVSPYKLFDDSELAKQVILLIHSFDKSSDPSDENVLLQLSSYIPTSDSISSFIDLHKESEFINYSVGEYNNSIDTYSNIIYRDCEEGAVHLNQRCDVYDLDIPTQAAYSRIDKIAEFIAKSEDKNVIIDNLDTKYLLEQISLTSFYLGDRYVFSFYPNNDDVIAKVYDTFYQSTDEMVLLDSNDSSTLVLEYISLKVIE